MESDASLAGLLEAARGGDPDALEQLLVSVEPRVFRFGMKVCRDPEDAREVLQETLLAAARSVKDFRGASSLSTWLFTIARNACLKLRRRGRGAPDADRSSQASPSRGSAAVVDPGPTPEDQLAASELQEVLEQAIASLDAANREILVLRDVEGLPASEVAEVVGLSVAAVKSRLHRARTAVRDAVARTLTAPPPPPRSDCPDVAALFSRHLEGDIDARTCADMEAHLASCPACRGRCDVLREILAACAAGPTPDVPPAVRASVRRALRACLAGAGTEPERPGGEGSGA